MILGRDRLTQEFKNLVLKERLSHGYLFFGPPRVGKALFARALAHYLERGVFDAEDGREAVLGDALYIRPGEGGTLGIDQVRTIRNFLMQKPNRSTRRTAIIEEAECMTTQAQNALLKVAEEPPSRGLLIVVTRDSEALSPTLRSRLQSVYVGPVAEELLTEWLVRDLGVGEKQAKEAAALSHGAPGFAAAFCKDERFRKALEEAESFLRMRPRERASFVKDLVGDERFDAGLFTEALIIASLPTRKTSAGFWHELFALRQNLHSFNLNPRLQLTALAHADTIYPHGDVS